MQKRPVILRSLLIVATPYVYALACVRAVWLSGMYVRMYMLDKEGSKGMWLRRVRVSECVMCRHVVRMYVRTYISINSCMYVVNKEKLEVAWCVHAYVIFFVYEYKYDYIHRYCRLYTNRQRIDVYSPDIVHVCACLCCIRR